MSNREIVLIETCIEDGVYDNNEVELTDELRGLFPLLKRVASAVEQSYVNWNTEDGENNDEHPYHLYDGVLTREEIDLFHEKFMKHARPCLSIIEISIQKIEETNLYKFTY
jgi:hypothetical protein